MARTLFLASTVFAASSLCVGAGDPCSTSFLYVVWNSRIPAIHFPTFPDVKFNATTACDPRGRCDFLLVSSADSSQALYDGVFSANDICKSVSFRTKPVKNEDGTEYHPGLSANLDRLEIEVIEVRFLNREARLYKQRYSSSKVPPSWLHAEGEGFVEMSARFGVDFNYIMIIEGN